MSELLAVIMGIGLAAACGFRVFVPLLVMCIAARAGAVTLAPNLAWVGSWEALLALGTASTLEIIAYKVPWLDHALDTIASPAAVIAGTLVAATQTGSISIKAPSAGPMLQWGAALIAGGAVAGVVQAGSVTTRLASTTVTGGVANPIISTAESILAVFTSILAVVAPVLAVVMLAVLGYVAYRVLRRFAGRRATLAAA